MRGLLLIYMMAFLSLHGQVSISHKKVDFGTINAFSERFVDIEIKNASKEKVYILRVNTEREVRYLYSRQTIEANTTETLRIKINPTQRGKFQSTVNLYLSSSNEPYDIRLKALIDELPSDASPSCPDFSGSTSMAEQMSFDFKIQVVNAQTQAPIHKANVKIISNGQTAFDWKTNKAGRIEKKFPLGYYYFVASAENFSGKEFDAFVNRRNHTLTIELNPLEKIEIPVKDTVELAINPVDSVEVKDPGDFEEIVIDLNEDPPTQETASEPKDTVETTPKEDQWKDFPESIYAPNNIILVLDISASMQQKGKLDLLKTSMLELLHMLRPIDRIGMVSFASKATVLAEPVLATDDNKQKLEEIITELQAKGSTNGGMGIRTGYQEAMSHYLGKGNNTIILTTDGAFNQEDKVFKKTIKKGVSKGITISVLGVKTVRAYEDELQSVADKGHGRFVQIKNYETAIDVLKTEIRTSSKK